MKKHILCMTYREDNIIKWNSSGQYNMYHYNDEVIWISKMQSEHNYVICPAISGKNWATTSLLNTGVEMPVVLSAQSEVRGRFIDESSAIPQQNRICAMTNDCKEFVEKWKYCSPAGLRISSMLLVSWSGSFELKVRELGRGTEGGIRQLDEGGANEE